jgi:DNA-binding transcriptional regulator YiaG
MTEQKKTALTKLEKKTIKDFRETGIMSEEEWARVQGMTYSELRRSSSVGSFLDEWENKYKKK